MIWLVFCFMWSVGGVYFGATAGYDFLHSRDDRDISNAQLAGLIIASGPLFWIVIIAIWAGWLR